MTAETAGTAGTAMAVEISEAGQPSDALLASLMARKEEVIGWKATAIDDGNGRIQAIDAIITQVGITIALVLQGSFNGVCIHCGTQISPERRKQKPEATACISCQAKVITRRC